MSSNIKANCYGSPLGVAKYISLLQGAAGLKGLGNTGLSYSLSSGTMLILTISHYNRFSKLMEALLQITHAFFTQYQTTCLSVISSHLYVGDFNCRHVNWGCNKTSPDGESLDSWETSNNLGLLCDPNKKASFSCHRWNVGTTPDLAFASFSQDSRLPERRVLGKLQR